MSLASRNLFGSNMNFTSHNHAHLENFLQNLAKKPDITSQSPPTRLPEIGKENYLKNYEFLYIDEVTKYEKLGKIGHGTFGEVFKARVRNNQDKLVALKKILMENETEGFPITALREFRILQLLNHENIINLIEICRTKPTKENRYVSTFYLVFDFCHYDLAGLLGNPKVQFTVGEIKTVMKQILNGLYYLHNNKILHRDMKSANILITKKGVLKLADFGLSRSISTVRKNRLTSRVITLWYRPPEVLLGKLLFILFKNFDREVLFTVLRMRI